MSSDARILVTRRLPSIAMDRISKFFPRAILRRSANPASPQELLRMARDAHGVVCLLTDRIDKRFLSGCPRLRAVSTVAVGTDNIDKEECRKRGIAVFNTPAVLTETTADLIWALLLAAARRVAEGDRFVRKGKFRYWAFDLLLGMDVYGKTLGVIGPGRIGSAVIRRARGFRMKVLFTGRRPRPGAVPLRKLLRESDFVVLTCPLTPETRGLVGSKEFSLMKPTAVFVNAARGPIVVERDLVRALRNRRIFAAGLDVYEREPRVPAALRRLDNAVLTPHIGSGSVATRERMALSAVDQIIEFFRRRG